MLSKFSGGLSLKVSGLGAKLKAMLPKRRAIDAEFLQRLEEILICSDLGAEVARNLLSKLPKGKACNLEDLMVYLTKNMISILEPSVLPIPIEGRNHPTVIVICGVNGSGKTTTIGKLAHHYVLKGKKVAVAAADTFRAAASDQIAIWTQRAGCSLIRGEMNSDPASVVFRAVDHILSNKEEILLVDTAGRLPSKANLMKELEKTINVIKKRIPSAPHSVLLILDATTGQNALAQIEQFNKSVNITGIILTKMDSSSKGGILIAIATRYPSIKIHGVGLGEGIEDLEDFNPSRFVQDILSLD